jgi:hypothetical protein
MAEPFVGRQRELDQLVDVLAQRSASSAALVGPRGVGKRSLARRLATLVGNRKSSALRGVRVLQLDAVGLVEKCGDSGAEVTHVISSMVERASAGTVLLIEDLDGSAEARFILSVSLKPALAAGKVRVVTTSTTECWERVLVENPSLAECFSVVAVREPSPEEALPMVAAHVPSLEGHSNVAIGPEAASAAVHLTARHLHTGALPRKALLALENAAVKAGRQGRTRLTPDDVAEAITAISGHAIAPREAIGDLLAELDAMQGIEEVKRWVRSLLARLQHELAMNEVRKQKGLKVEPVALHTVFYGPPGTGKTTVARLVARILYSLDLLSRGHLVEASRANFIGPHIGSTAPKTNAVVDSALGGALFLDEAYSMQPSPGGADFAGEANTELIARMENDRDKFCFIAAGYTRPMQEWLASNPGFQSRFAHYIEFPAFEPDVLWSILSDMLAGADYRLTDDAAVELNGYVTALYEERDPMFGNAREMRNLADAVASAQSDAIGHAAVDIETRRTITAETVCNARAKYVERRRMAAQKEQRSSFASR